MVVIPGKSNLTFTCDVYSSSDQCVRPANIFSRWKTTAQKTRLNFSRITIGSMSVKICALLLAIVIPSKGEVFSSVSDMQAIFKLERNLVGEMLNYAEKLQKKLSRIKK